MDDEEVKEDEFKMDDGDELLDDTMPPLDFGDDNEDDNFDKDH